MHFTWSSTQKTNKKKKLKNCLHMSSCKRAENCTTTTTKFFKVHKKFGEIL